MVNMPLNLIPLFPVRIGAAKTFQECVNPILLDLVPE